jgi:hypothetical protein
MLAKIGNDGRQAIITSHARGYVNVLQKRGTALSNRCPGPRTTSIARFMG